MRVTGRARRVVAGCVGAVALVTVGSCAGVGRLGEPGVPTEWKPADTLQVGHEDAFNFIHRVEIDAKGGTGGHQVLRIAPGNLGFEAPIDRKPASELAPPPPRRPPSKVHPLLAEWIAGRNATEEVEIIVHFDDSLKIPRLPALPAGVDRDSPEAKPYVEARRHVIDEIRKLREQRQRAALDKIAADERTKGRKFNVLESFWLTNAAIVRMPIGAAKALSEQPEVLYLQPRFAGEKPPQDANPDNDAIDGRARIVSDPYFDLGLTSGWIGLLDTGVRRSHTMFNSPGRLGFVYDCVNGGSNCNNTGAAGYDPNDDCWNHGTSSAGIISGNANRGAAYRGVTAVTLDSLKVYPNGCGGLDSGATVRAFERAIEIFDSVIVAEMQASEGDQGTIAKAAENAFDAGGIIIAANGNFGPAAGTVRSPANAHKVIGVGAYDVVSLATTASQGRGPTSDARIKPDIQTPTNTETASNASDTALKTFGGTSGATPYASGAAALFRNWLRRFGTYDPGQVYAFMVLAGQQPYPFGNTEGADDLRMPVNGYAWWGKTAIVDGGVANIDFALPSGMNRIDAAIWWPQASAWWEGLSFLGFTFPLLHNDIDLRLRNPSGGTVRSSLSIPSVFEKVRVNGPLATGTWRIRINGYNVRSGPQTVYWAVAATR